MNNLTKISVTAPQDVVLKKLAWANIAVFNIKQLKKAVSFDVYDETVKKVFAIFRHPCYNVSIRKNSLNSGTRIFMLNRPALAIGLAIFIAISLICNNLIFKIEVTGSGSYLKNQVCAIVADNSKSFCNLLYSVDELAVQSRIVAIKDVTFCSVKIKGSVIVVDVQTNTDNTAYLKRGNLIAECSGVLVNLVVICGQAEKNIGQTVERGDVLITQISDDNANYVQGYATIKCSQTQNMTFDDDTPQNRQRAISALSLYGESVADINIEVKPCGDKWQYEVNFTYLVTTSINIQ